MADITWTPFRSLMTNLLTQRYAGGTVPANFYLILCSGAGWTDSASISDVIATEISTAGYTRILLGAPTITYDALQFRGELVFPRATVTADAVSLIYERAVIISGANASDNTGTPEFYAPYSSTQEIFAGTSHYFDVFINLGRAGSDVEAA